MPIYGLFSLEAFAVFLVFICLVLPYKPQNQEETKKVQLIILQQRNHPNWHFGKHRF